HVTRRLQCGEEGPGDVLRVHEGSPGAAVALEPDLAPGVRGAHEVVHHDVGPQTRRGAVGGGVAEVRGAEVVVRQVRDPRLGQHLALAVGGDRVQLGVLGEPPVAAGPVQRARRGQQVAGHPGGLGDPREVHGTVRVDRVRGRGVEVADGVVGDRCEVDDRLEGGEVVGFDVTDVAGALLVAVGHRSEVATVVPAGVEPDDLVPGLPQERYHHGAEVAPVTGHEYPHGL